MNPTSFLARDAVVTAVPEAFGFGSERIEQRLSAPTDLEQCVTTSVPLPGTGQNALKQFRL